MNKTSDHIHALSIIHHKGNIRLLVSLDYSFFLETGRGRYGTNGRHNLYNHNCNGMLELNKGVDVVTHNTHVRITSTIHRIHNRTGFVYMFLFWWEIRENSYIVWTNVDLLVIWNRANIMNIYEISTRLHEVEQRFEECNTSLCRDTF